MRKNPAVYMLASGRDGTLYVGVTSNLAERVWQHRSGWTPGVYRAVQGGQPGVVRVPRDDGARYWPGEGIEEVAPGVEDSGHRIVESRVG